jgi:hypothetical protein
MMKKILFIAAIVLLFISAIWYSLYYTPCKGVITVQKIEQEQVVKIPVSKQIKQPTTAFFEVNGTLDDTAQLQGVPLVPIGGKINEAFRIDQYSDTLNVIYTPYKAKKGNLKITYKVY